jgi:Rps23 Pro-64 3,4-dihydroxylase Tpa1-like proline 4-hydroxylase
LYCLLQEWRPEWGGNLMFYKGTEVVKCVSYVPNRAVMFPAKFNHGAEAPSKEYDGMRVSFAWKLFLQED